ncbi:glycoside hydrolase [Mycolicibacterium stellerae]|uniref:glycoside hydrolase n=1 Tax=Mycolicibacterium stellerae TaxID=2358193 RepID=UPI000F0B9AA0|nr:glycoside hydrolase [Mycolicibacterium stellerae]
MGRGVLANGGGRLLVVVASVAVSAAMIYDQTTDAKSSEATSAGQGAVASSAPVPASPAAPDLIAASAPVANQATSFALPVGIAPEQGLQVHTIWVARAIGVMFPEITTIGGARQDALKWHPNGLAIDVMIPNHNTDEGIELGNQIAGLALANAKRWGVIHVIWRQGFYPGIGAPSWTADYGNETANHYDHVHIATDGGGYPTGQETYFIGSMSPAPLN